MRGPAPAMHGLLARARATRTPTANMQFLIIYNTKLQKQYIYIYINNIQLAAGACAGLRWRCRGCRRRRGRGARTSPPTTAAPSPVRVRACVCAARVRASLSGAKGRTLCHTRDRREPADSPAPPPVVDTSVLDPWHLLLHCNACFTSPPPPVDACVCASTLPPAARAGPEPCPVASESRGARCRPAAMRRRCSSVCVR